MCGIIAISSTSDVSDELLKGIRRLKYRGYDSSGVAVYNGKFTEHQKQLGILDTIDLHGCVGIGHTRWATTGKISVENAHPHSDNLGIIHLVHNGIIENYRELKEKCDIMTLGDTDTAVLANLVVKYPIKDLVSIIEGRYAFVYMRGKNICGVTNGNPLILGVGDSLYLASDINAIPSNVQWYAFLPDKTQIKIFGQEYGISDFNGNNIDLELTYIEREDNTQISSDYTFKEIQEQANYRTKIEAGCLKDLDDPILIGCGSSYNVCEIIGHMFGCKYTLGSHACGIEGTIIAVSQSGETYDIIEPITAANENGWFTISLTNNEHSTLSRLSDEHYNIDCGPEISVAATKSFLAQFVSLYAAFGGTVPEYHANVEKLILSDVFKDLAAKYHGIKNVYVIGSGIDYSIAKEGALKLKEIALVHAEAIPAAELKHGSLSLIDEDWLVISINCDPIYIEQVKARNCPVLEINTEDSFFMRVIEGVVSLQLLSYYLAKARGLNPDCPRNLAKSCTTK